MEVSSIDVAIRGKGYIATLDNMLSKHLRFEKYCYDDLFHVTMKVDSILNIVTRYWWENNRLYQHQRSKIIDMDKMIFEMHLSLGEALDYIYAVTPPLLRGNLYDGLVSVKDVCETLRTYLMEQAGGLEAFHHSKFQEMTLLNREQSVSTLHGDILKRAQLIVDKVAQSSPDPCITVYVLDAHTSPKKLVGDMNKRGIYIFHAWNRGFIYEIIDMIHEYESWSILDYYHSNHGGHFITIALGSPDENATPNKMTKKFDDIIQTSYGWT